MNEFTRVTKNVILLTHPQRPATFIRTVKKLGTNRPEYGTVIDLHTAQ